MFVRHIIATGILIILSISSFVTLPEVLAASSCSASLSSAWQICGPIESGNALNVQPNVIQASDGSLRMVWTSLQGSSDYAIYYAVGSWDGASWGWSAGSDITTSAGKNQNPAIAQLVNSTLYMFWAYKPIGTSNYQLYYITQNGGLFTRTYTKVPLTNPTTLNDTLATASVGRDGTLWLLWIRDNSTFAGTSHIMRQVWYKTMKNGMWSPEQPLTLASDVNWNYQPSILVGKDGVVRVAFSRGQMSLLLR